MTIRKLIFWMHLAAGVSAGIVILIMSVTGVLLAFERQISSWLQTPPVPAATGVPMSTEALLLKIYSAHANSAAPTIIWSANQTVPVSVSYGREKTLFLHPATGEILGEGSARVRGFFQWVTEWHRYLARSGEGRSTGKAITGAANLVFLFIVASGFYLWWPRNWSWKSFKSVTTFGAQLRGKARDWNWHNVVGFWCALPLFFIVLTGSLISYPWATNLLYRITRSEPPKPQQPRSAAVSGSTNSNPRVKTAVEASPSFDDINGLWATAAGQMANWKTITLRMPNDSAANLSFVLDGSHRGRPDLRKQISLDRQTGKIISQEDFTTYNLGRKLRTWGRWMHTGELGGLPGQIIAAVATAGGVVLVWTGLALAFRRFFSKRISTDGEAIS